jgi:putative transposase
MGMQELDRLHHCVYALTYHLVLVTKYRRAVLTAPMLAAFEAMARERAAAWGGRLIEVNGEADHVHLLLTLPPTVALAGFVNALKTGTSRRLRRGFPEQVNRYYRRPVLWSRSYCVITAGGAPLAVLRRYVENQTRPDG